MSTLLYINVRRSVSFAGCEPLCFAGQGSECITVTTGASRIQRCGTQHSFSNEKHAMVFTHQAEISFLKTRIRFTSQSQIHTALPVT